MEKHTTDNYELLCADWQKRMLQLDTAELMKKLPELRLEGSYLTLSHYHRRYGVSLQDGTICRLDGAPEEPISLFTRLNIYTLLWYCTGRVSSQDDWVPFRSLKDASPFAPAFQRSVIQVFSRTFSGHLPELERAFLALGGQRLAVSDLGYQLDAFECIPVQFLFWDGDDEFPAQSNLLFRRNCVDFIHVESIVSIATEGLAHLSKLSGIPLKSGGL